MNADGRAQRWNLMEINAKALSDHMGITSSAPSGENPSRFALLRCRYPLSVDCAVRARFDRAFGRIAAAQFVAIIGHGSQWWERGPANEGSTSSCRVCWRVGPGRRNGGAGCPGSVRERSHHRQGRRANENRFGNCALGYAGWHAFTYT